MARGEELFGQGPLQDDVAPLVAAAHELKTPLAVIAYLAAALRDEVSPLDKAQQQIYLERIALSTERMARLVDGFTQAYRLADERQLSLLGLEPVNVANVMDEAAHELQPLASQLDQTIELNSTSRLSLAVANRDLLRSVVINLLDNALKHNPAGSHVRLGVVGRGQYLRAVVKDNGSQLSRHELRALRDQLGRQLQPLSGRAQSSGLGLYIAARLTRAMGGKLGVICHPVAGASFYADLQRSTQLSLL